MLELTRKELRQAFLIRLWRASQRDVSEIDAGDCKS
jgi:hypothetical protein